MIDHNMQIFDMYENDVGTMVFPSEVGNTKMDCNLRQFLVLAARLFEHEVLQENLIGLL